MRERKKPQNFLEIPRPIFAFPGAGAVAPGSGGTGVWWHWGAVAPGSGARVPGVSAAIFPQREPKAAWVKVKTPPCACAVTVLSFVAPYFSSEFLTSFAVQGRLWLPGRAAGCCGQELPGSHRGAGACRLWDCLTDRR